MSHCEKKEDEMVLAHCRLSYILRLYDLACRMLKVEFSKRKNTFYGYYEIFSVAFKASRKKRVSKHLQSDINFFTDTYISYQIDRHMLLNVSPFILSRGTRV